MMTRGSVAAGLAACLVLAAPEAAAAPRFPELTGRVVDNANILSQPVETQLASKLEALEDTTGRQLVVVTLPDLQGYEIEDYGYQLGRAWKIGRTAQNDGTLFLVAPQERSVRIEVGYGLEDVLTDALSSTLLNQRVLPHFRNGELEQGVVDGAEALIEQLSLPAGEASARAQEARSQSGKSFEASSLLSLLVVFWLLVMFLRGKGPRRRTRLAPWLLPSIILSSGRGGGWGGSSGGGGGFRGGGGSFGGGGASGRW